MSTENFIGLFVDDDFITRAVDRGLSHRAPRGRITLQNLWLAGLLGRQFHC